ncbi:hypothetical protein Q5752_003009 [Cryptotrichosporon argae]
MEEDGPDAKRRKTVAKKPFKPHPLPASSSTPPEDDISFAPPPPSERKIARRRPSMAARLARAPSPTPTASRPARALSAFDDEPASLSAAGALAGPAPPGVPHLSFKPSTRPRPSAPPPLSPNRLDFGSSSLPPPPATGRKKVRGDTVVDSTFAIPLVGDTPVINKNKEMRRDAARRSSLGMRGQRASGSFGRGEPSHPHSSVSTASFYKHIPNDTPDPVKARYLIAWVAKRALDAQTASSTSQAAASSSSGTRTAEGANLFGQIVDDFIGGLAKGRVDTNTFPQPGMPPPAMPLKPHVKNVLNKKEEKVMDQAIKRSKAEERDWQRIRASHATKQRVVLARLEDKVKAAAEPDLSTAPAWMRNVAATADEVIQGGEGELAGMGEFADVEYKVDTLQQTVHAAKQYSDQASRYLDGIFASLHASLRAREAGPSTSTAEDRDGPDAVSLLAAAATSSSSSAKPRRGAPVDPIHMLRALAAADATQQDALTIAKAAAVPPNLSASATPRRPAPTPRRKGDTTTPRRAGVYGRATPAVKEWSSAPGKKAREGIGRDSTWASRAI